MTPVASFNAWVIYWGRGLQVGPADYGFLLSEEAAPRVLRFNANHLSPDSLPPQIGMAAYVVVGAGQDGYPSFQLTLRPTEPTSPQRLIIHSLALARVVAVESEAVLLLTLPGQSARLTWGDRDEVQLQVGDYVRCRLIETVNGGLKASVAFDAVRVDFNDPIEQARLEAYLRQSSGEGVADSGTVGHPVLKRPKRNRKSEWADFPEVKKGIKYDLNRNELQLPNREGLKLVEAKPEDPKNAKQKKTAKLIAEFYQKALPVIASHPKANGFLMRGIAHQPEIPLFEERYSLKPAALAVYPMYKGLAQLVGMHKIEGPQTIAEQCQRYVAEYDNYDFF